MLDQAIQRLRNTVRNLVTRVTVDRSGKYVQLKGLGDNVRPDVESFQPQGFYSRPPAGAVGVMVAPAGDGSAAVALGLHKRSALPTTPNDGECGLHYLGTWKVFVAADGSVHLGAKDPGDFVALASKVDAAISTLKTAIGAGFTAVGVGVAANGPAGKTAFDSAAAAIASSASSEVKCG